MKTDDDKLINVIIKRIGADNYTSIKKLRNEFIDNRNQAIFNIFVNENVSIFIVITFKLQTLKSYLLGKFKFAFYNLFIGHFDREYLRKYLDNHTDS